LSAESLSAEEFGKSVNISQRYVQGFSAMFVDSRCILCVDLFAVLLVFCLLPHMQYCFQHRQNNVNMITHEPLHLAWWNLHEHGPRQSLETFKFQGQVKGQGHSHMFFVCFCVHVITVTRELLHSGQLDGRPHSCRHMACVHHNISSAFDPFGLGKSSTSLPGWGQARARSPYSSKMGYSRKKYYTHL